MKEIIENITGADIVVVLAAIIGLISSVYTNYRLSKFQGKWNQKQLDADLKAKSRIEWIQKVRGTTAELIALYNKILNEKDKEKLFDEFMAAREKSELLILYFGPESPKKTDNKNIKETLLQESNNDGKNKFIVDFLSELSKRFYEYYNSILKDKLVVLENMRKERTREMYENPVDFVEIETQDSEGYNIIEKIPIPDPDIMKEKNEIDIAIGKYSKNIKDLDENLCFLRDTMRIYLKIEWNKAKSGQ
jgi:hypothetical protein